MRSKLFKIIYLGCCMALPATAAPSEDKPPLPSGPLLRVIPDASAWKIVYTDLKGASAEAGAQGTSVHRELTVTKFKPYYHAVYQEKAKSWEVWYDGTTTFYIDPDSPKAPLALGAEAENFVPPTVSRKNLDLSDLKWVSADTYLGIQKVKDISCMVFKNAANETVWISEESRFPVVWSNGIEARNYIVLPPPTTKLDPPEQMAAFVKGFHQMRTNDTRGSPRTRQ